MTKKMIFSCIGVVVIAFAMLFAYRYFDDNNSVKPQDIDPRKLGEYEKIDLSPVEPHAASDGDAILDSRKNEVVEANLNLAMEGMARNLDLSKEQIEKIRDIYREETISLVKKAEKSDRSGKEWRETVKQAMEARDRRVREELNDDQMKRFDELTKNRKTMK